MRTTFALLGLLLCGAALAAVTRGQRAPDFSLATLAGKRVSLSGQRGKVVIVDFWAQWCEPCKKELPELDKLAGDFAARGVVILAVNIDKERENAERLVRQLGGLSHLQVPLDPTGSTAAAYDLPKMPTSFVVDKKGIVRYVHDGFEGAADVDRFRTELTDLVR